MSFEIDPEYVDVAARIREFREKHAEGSLQQVSLDFRQVADQWWVIYTAAAYRTPDDPRPGQGTAWETVPGKTPFTKGSELQNAETAAWGRAIVAALAADTKKVATVDDLQNRHAEQDLLAVKKRVWAKAHDLAADKSPDGVTQFIQAAVDIRGYDKDNADDLGKLLQEWETK